MTTWYTVFWIVFVTNILTGCSVAYIAHKREQARDVMLYELLRELWPNIF